MANFISYIIFYAIKKFYPEFQVFFENDVDFFFTKEKKIFMFFSNNITSKSIEIPNFILVKKKKTFFFKDIVRNSTTLLQFLNLKKNCIFITKPR